MIDLVLNIKMAIINDLILRVIDNNRNNIHIKMALIS